MALIELKGYREWTESIGDDREWRLQALQSRIYTSLQEAAAEVNGFIMPMRYDYMVAVASGMGERELLKLYRRAEGESPVPVSMASACGSSPVEAVEEAWRHIKAEGGFKYLPCTAEEGVVAGHFDMNGITAMTKRFGVLATYSTMLHVVSEIELRAHYRGGMAQYLGGDNVLVILPADGYEEIVEELVAVHDLKVGVGVSRHARGALALAAEALHEIRSGVYPGRINVKARL